MGRICTLVSGSVSFRLVGLSLNGGAAMNIMLAFMMRSNVLICWSWSKRSLRHTVIAVKVIRIITVTPVLQRMPLIVKLRAFVLEMSTFNVVEGGFIGCDLSVTFVYCVHLVCFEREKGGYRNI